MYHTLRYEVIPYDQKLHQELEVLGVKFIQVCPEAEQGPTFMRFVVEENSPNFSQIKSLLPEQTENSLEELWRGDPVSLRVVSVQATPHYTEAERLGAQWLLVRTSTIKGYPENEDTLEDGKCVKRIHPQGYPVYYHTNQQEPVMLKCPVKWGNFSYFGMAYFPLFCSDRAVAFLEKSGLQGFRFGPVLHWSTREPFDNIFQIHSDPVLPEESIVPVQDAEFDPCPLCGQQCLRYTGPKPLLKIHPECLDPEVDFYSSPTLSLNLVSQRAYRFLKEKKMLRGLIFTPLETN